MPNLRTANNRARRARRRAALGITRIPKDVFILASGTAPSVDMHRATRDRFVTMSV
jgi:hypothetical protein